MMASPATEVLRDVVIHVRPKTLGRPHSALPNGAGNPPEALAPVAQDVLANERRVARSEGFDKGYADGLRAGLAEGERAAAAKIEHALNELRARMFEEAAAQRTEAQAHVERATERLSALERAFSVAAEQRLQALEEDAVALAFEAVCRISGEQAGVAERIAGLVSIALRSVSRESLLRIRIHPDDLSTLKTSASGPDLLGRTAPVQWIDDPTLTAGGCVLETRYGLVDARMDTQLERLKNTWADAVRSCSVVSDGGVTP